ncbi:MAG: pilus assembly protein PilM [Omnitrophica bacterium]|nr:pilus assembly protein PilM [Candidatus Omnitrophota bacterium]
MKKLSFLNNIGKPENFSKLTKFLRVESREFTCLNLGSCFLKGLVVKGKKVISYFSEKNEGLEATIKRLRDEKKISLRDVRVSVKNPSCLVRYFSFPKTDRKKLRQTLFYELNKFIPFPSEEVYFDFFVLKETNPSELLILLAVAKKNFVDKILSIFSNANLNVSEINLDSVCITNLFLNNNKDQEKNVCILDIGYSFSTMTILNKNTPFLTRDIKASTKDIFQIIARTKNIELSDVEKWVLELKDKKEFLNLCRDSIFDICKEIKSSFDYFEVNKGELIDKLYLTGGLLFLEGIDNIFKEALDIEAEVLNTFPKPGINLDKSFSSKEFDSFKNSFTVPFGLSL